MTQLHTPAAKVLDTIYGLYAGFALIAVTSPTLILLAILPGEDRRRRLVRAAAALLFRLLGAAPQVRGFENLPDGPCIAVANHASYLDGMLLTATLPPRFTFVIKREMTRVPFASFLLRRIGSEFVERFDRSRGAADARRLVGHARRARSLAFFPEGTFVAEPGLQRFRNGAFVAAKRGGLPLVPITIRGTRDMLPAGRWLARPGATEVVISAPVEGPATSTELMQRSRDRILAHLGEPDRLAAPSASIAERPPAGA